MVWLNYTYTNRDEEETEYDMEKDLQNIKKEIQREWQRRWNEDGHGRQTFRFMPEVSFAFERPWFAPSRFCTYAITGYGPINSTLHKRGAAQEAKCTFCSEEETIEHMLFICPGYNEERRGINNIKEGRNNPSALIKYKDNFTGFIDFIDTMFEKRKTYLSRTVETDPPPHGMGLATARLQVRPRRQRDPK